MGAPVLVNVYDLSDQNSWTYWCGVGIFHSGVEVFGCEYAYGGHEYDVSGVFATNPRDAPGPVIYRESVVMGETSLTPAQVQQVVHELGQSYKGNAYHLLERNCNHFSSDLCKKLTGKPAPLWINRLAGMAVMLHCLLPTAWVPPLTPPTAAPALGPVTSASAAACQAGQEERVSLLSAAQQEQQHQQAGQAAVQKQQERQQRQQQQPSLRREAIQV